MNKEKAVQQKWEIYLKLKEGYVARADSKHLPKGMLTAILPVLSLNMANGQCQGTQTTSLALKGASTGINIDVDGDGTDDFRIFDPVAPYLRTLHISALNGGKVLTSGGSGTVKKYGGGATISGNNYSTYGGVWWLVYQTAGAMAGPWGPAYPNSGYIGIKQGGKYGFIQLTLVSGATSTSGARPDFVISISEAGLGESPSLTVNAGTCSSLLPVELVKFEAIKAENSIRLSWATATEINNAGFDIQRSTDGKTFRTLDFVEGHGTTSEQQEYYYEDKSLRKGQPYYYRLKQIDYDGRFEYSDVVTASLAINDISGVFAPNPSFNGRTNLKYSTPQDGRLDLSIFDVTGKELLRQSYEVAEGRNQINLDLNSLGKGMFFVKMKQDEHQAYKKVVLK